MSLQRERTLILTALLILTAASWALLIWHSRTANTMGMGLTMSMGAALFLAIWVVMMIAMMFPAAAQMILVFAQVQRDRRRGGWAFVPTWIFAGAYLLIWTLFGGLSYLGANVSGVLAQQVRLERLRGTGTTGPLAHDECVPDRWWYRGTGRALPTHTSQTCLPGEMLHTSGFHPPFLA